MCSNQVLLRRSSFQLLGTCCLWVAAKFEEIYPPSSAEMLDMTANTFT